MAVLGRPKRRDEGSQQQVLDVTASMEGSLVFQEPVVLRISGHFGGNLETKGELTVGERAVVQANLTGEIITIAGRVTGKVIAKQLLKIVPPAVLKGEIWTPVLQVEPGAHVEGTLHMEEEGGRMTLQEVAGYLEVESRLVEQWAREGKIPGVQEGAQWRFDKVKIDEWVALQKSS